jgi:hypothetical protein
MEEKQCLEAKIEALRKEAMKEKSVWKPKERSRKEREYFDRPS